jgi:hypothetical protein
MDNQTTKTSLIQILENCNVNHSTEVMSKTCIKDALIYCKINQLSGQVYGPLIEAFIKVFFNMHKNHPSLCIGDLHHNETNIEIKVSLGGKNNNKFNFVQLRINHLCDYILVVYYLDIYNIDNFGELFIFRLKKPDLPLLIFKYGSYAHGTITKLGKITLNDLINEQNSKEYAIRTKYNDACWNHLLQYRVNEIDI